MKNPPAWVKDSVFYQIFPDRYAINKKADCFDNLETWNSLPTYNGFKGGNFEGIIDKLDWIKELGFNAIYFTPVFCSTANHRYHTTDYYKIDPLLGGNKVFKKFLNTAHDKGFKVVLDGVFNHVGRGFYQFVHVLENGLKSPYINWFYFNKVRLKQGINPIAYPRKNINNHSDGFHKYGYSCWWSLPDLPKLNIGNPEVKKFILNITKYWLEFGIDGWRLDVPEEINDDLFWKDFRKTVKKTNPEAYIVGEIWGNAKKWLKGDKFDGVMNYLLGKSVIAVSARENLPRKVVKNCAYNTISRLSIAEFKNNINEIIQLYPYEFCLSQLNLLSSHDTPRIKTLFKNDEDSVKFAFKLLWTLPGAPCLYYGDELGMKGKHDPDCRRTYPFNYMDFNKSMINFIKSINFLRNKYKSFRHGGFKTVENNRNVFSFIRTSDAETLIIAANTEKRKKQVTIYLSDKILKKRNYYYNITDEKKNEVKNNSISFKINPQTVDVFKLLI